MEIFDDSEQAALFFEEPFDPNRMSVPPETELISKLKEVFELEDFRPGQLNAIRNVIDGKDCFVRMPTGSGKSLIWQLPAAIQANEKKLSVIIFPTKSLLNDQMSRIVEIFPHIEAISYHGDQPRNLNQSAEYLLELSHNLPDCLLILPEPLMSSHAIYRRLEELYKEDRIARFVIDEVDKFLDWGQSFRREYLALELLRGDFPKVPLLAMTGSITEANRRRTIETLHMNNPVFVDQSLNRPNIYYGIRRTQLHSTKASWNEIICDIERNILKGQGIIYCSRKDDTEYWVRELRDRGIMAESYTSKLNGEERIRVVNSWTQDDPKLKTRVIVATVAFGMGIDKVDVRWVVHDSQPSSIEGWMQESGRAGRDGSPADSIVYFRASEYRQVRKLIADSSIQDSQFKRQLEDLHLVTEVLLNETECTRRLILAHFDEEHSSDCGFCSVCQTRQTRDSLSTHDMTSEAEKILLLLEQMRQLKCKKHWSETMLLAAIKGDKIEGAADCKSYGCQLILPSGKGAKKSEIEVFLLILILHDVFEEYTHQSIPLKAIKPVKHVYIKPGRNASKLGKGLKIEIPKNWEHWDSEEYAWRRRLDEENMDAN